MVFDYYDTKVIGALTLAGDEIGLRQIDFETARRPLCIDPGWKKDPAYGKATREHLAAYFHGELRQFDLPLAPHGTPFQQAVWSALRTIPYGAVVSYKWIAEKVGNPNAVRAVGGANGRNPLPVVIPCHRVIGSDGTLTGFGGGLGVKERLIRLENPNYAGLCGGGMVCFRPISAPLTAPPPAG
jgi:methylated-DNA-[protein]-cysteine S-methyltransferase